MLKELLLILCTQEKYNEKDYESFINSIQCESEDNDYHKEISRINSLYFKGFNKTIAQETKDATLYIKFLKKYSLSVDQINTLKVDYSVKDLRLFKQYISQAKSELPQKLMNLYELDSGAIINRDGNAISINEYVLSTGERKEDVLLLIEDAKNIISQKIRRFGYVLKESE